MLYTLKKIMVLQPDCLNQNINEVQERYLGDMRTCTCMCMCLCVYVSVMICVCVCVCVCVYL